jgi:hypothetical protein
MVARGHMTETPSSMTYASVVLRKSVQIALMLAALNDLQVKTADIEHANLTTPVSEKIWTTLGPELGKDWGCTWAGIIEQEKQTFPHKNLYNGTVHMFASKRFGDCLSVSALAIVFKSQQPAGEVFGKSRSFPA